MGSQRIFLSQSREAAIAASGKSILDLIDLGLEAAGREKLAHTVQPGPDNYRSRPTRDTCKHPPARRAKGLCMACGTHVG